MKMFFSESTNKLNKTPLYRNTVRNFEIHNIALSFISSLLHVPVSPQGRQGAHKVKISTGGITTGFGDNVGPSRAWITPQGPGITKELYTEAGRG